MTIPLTQLLIGNEERTRLMEVLDSGYLASGPRVAEFEAALSDYFGFDHSVAVGSGTDAIRLALAALNVGPGQDVVVPDFCFPSVAAAVLQTGARCLLCDVDPNTYNMTPETVASTLTPATTAVVVVHQFGVPCDAMKIAAVSPCPVIEDAACALGAKDTHGYCGTQTELGCFSFHPRKIVTTAEGGLVISSNPQLAERCRWLRSHGFHRSGGMTTFEEPGFSARMSDVHAAIGLGQLANIETIITGRARSAAMYRQAFQNLDGICDNDATWHPNRVYQSMVVNLAPEIDRDQVVAHLRKSGIESTIGTYAIHRLSAFSDCVVPSAGLAGSTEAYLRSITLPLWPDMDSEVVEKVVAALGEVVR